MQRRTFLQAVAAFFGFSKAGFEKPQAEEPPIELELAKPTTDLPFVKLSMLYVGKVGIMLKNPKLSRVYPFGQGPRNWVYLDVDQAIAPSAVMREFSSIYGDMRNTKPPLVLEFDDGDRITLEDASISSIGIGVVAQDFAVSENLMLCAKVKEDHLRILG